MQRTALQPDGGLGAPAGLCGQEDGGGGSQQPPLWSPDVMTVKSNPKSR